jgi:polyisoprenoid-binding protein YceI
VNRTGRRENMAEAPPGRRAQFEYGREQYTQERYPPLGYPQDGAPPNGYPPNPYGQEPYPRDQFTQEQAPPMREREREREPFEYGRTSQGRQPIQRRRRKGPLVLLAVVILLGGVAAGVMLGVPDLLLGSGNAPKPVGLVDAPGAQAAGTPEGNWNILRGNTTFVGYRVKEKLAAVTVVSDAVGRTPTVTGGMSIFGGQVVGAQINADLRGLASDKPKRDEVIRGRGLETNKYPQAAFQLTQPVKLGQVTSGKVVNLWAVGKMTLHGVTRQVRFPLQGRWDGNTLQVAGRITIRFSDYRIQTPNLAGFVKVQPWGQMELSLVMQRS